MQEFNFKQKIIMGEGGRGEGYMSGKIGCKQTQLDHVIRVTATLKAILPCNIVFVKILELGIHL